MDCLRSIFDIEWFGRFHPTAIGTIMRRLFNHHWIVWIVASFLFAGLMFSGCQKAAENTSPLKRQGKDPINVVCTTGMVADLVKQVGGKHVNVTQLMGEGTDPHLYKVSTKDVSSLKSADMIFYSGLHLEGNLVSTFESLSQTIPTYAVAEEIHRWKPSKILKTEGTTHDPHVWFDVATWGLTLKMIADRLADFDPEHADEFVANFNDYSEKLDALDAECRKEIAKIPEGRRVLVTAHDAFHYFGEAYGMQVKAIQGVSTESDPSTQHIEELVAFLVKNKIKAVFVESSVPHDNIKPLIDGCKAQGHTLIRGGELFSDAMGEPGTTKGTYEGMIRHNVTTIVNALK